MPGVRTYNPERINLIVNGLDVKGFADGTFLTISTVGDGVTTQVGADGEIARAISTDRRCNVTITLQQTSPANDHFSKYYHADMLSCGQVMGPIMLQDLCGTTLFQCSTSWITKPADIELGKEISNRVWVLQTGSPAIYNVGSNVAM